MTFTTAEIKSLFLLAEGIWPLMSVGKTTPYYKELELCFIDNIGGLKQALGDIFIHELLAKCPMVKSYHLCFTLIPWESKNNR